MMDGESEAWITSLNKGNRASLLEWIEGCNINLVQVGG